MQKTQEESKTRKAKDFGFDLMEYEEAGNVHSTNLVWNLSPPEFESL